MKSITALLLAATMVFLTGCNTVKGMGQDLKKASEKIEESVKK